LSNKSISCNNCNSKGSEVTRIFSSI